MHSKQTCVAWPRLRERRDLVDIARQICVIVALCGGLTTAHCAERAHAGEGGVLRVLKLRHQQANHPHRDSVGEFRLLSEFAQQNNLDLQWIDAVQPGALVRSLKRGDGDIVIADLAPSSAVDKSLAHSLSMGAFHYALYGRRDLQAKNPAELAGLRVAITLSSPLWPYFNALAAQVPGLAVVVLPDDTVRADVLQGIAEDRYDAAAVAERPAEDPAQSVLMIKRLFLLSRNDHARWHFSAKNTALRDRLDSFLQRYHAALGVPQAAAFGDLDQIRDRHVVRVITRVDPQNYFLKRGRPTGFEYDLVRLFARSNGLGVEFLVAESDEQALQWLAGGVGDLIATRISAGAVDADPTVRQSRSYFYSASVIVQRNDGLLLDADALAGKRIGVVENSVQHRALSGLVANGVGIEPVVFGAATTPEQIATHVEQFDVDAAIVDAYAVSQVLETHPRIAAAASISSDFNYAWTLRSDDVQLDKAVDAFLTSNFRKETYNVLARRYFEKPRIHPFVAIPEFSPYDEVVRRYAESFDFDWRLIVAQMYQESKFNPHAESSGGARGLMQLLPATALSVGVANAFDPEAGIRGGVTYLNRMRERFDLNISPSERTWFALAAYNAGFDRINQARKQALHEGLDSNRWFGHVEKIMRKMARAGRSCGCGQAVAYVRRIRSLYNTYNHMGETLTADVRPAAEMPRI